MVICLALSPPSGNAHRRGVIDTPPLPRGQLMKKNAYSVRLRRETGEEHDRLIFAVDETTASERAVERARLALGKTMAERTYGQFEVLSCVSAPRGSR